MITDSVQTVLAWEAEWVKTRGRLSVGMAKAAARGCETRLTDVWAGVIARAVAAEGGAWAQLQKEQIAQRLEQDAAMKAASSRHRFGY